MKLSKKDLLNIVACLKISGGGEFDVSDEDIGKAMETLDDLSMYFFNERVGDSIEKVNRLWEAGLPYTDDSLEKVEFKKPND